MKLAFQTIRTEVLVIGAGAAGIRAALAACQAGVQVTLVTGQPVGRGGSTFSTLSKGWGIQALMGDERNDAQLQLFFDEIMQAGLGRCDPRLVEILVQESGDRLDDLMRYGLRFRRTADGDILRVAGCFGKLKRAFLTEDFDNMRQTFRAMLAGVDIDTIRATALDLIVVDGKCRGAWILNPAGMPIRVQAKAVILATGGGAGIFDSTHAPGRIQTGTGYAMAHRAGAILDNMEFIQFMLGMKDVETLAFLRVSEIDKSGRLCDKLHSDLLDKAFHDPGTRSLAVQVRSRHFPFSSRDISHHIDIAVACERQKGSRVYWQSIMEPHRTQEVFHFAHAFNGGIKIDEHAESSIKGLYAAGEIAAGPHGADRVGGCMMTATQVFGERAGRYAAAFARGFGDDTFGFEDKHTLETLRLLSSAHDHGEAIEIENHVRKWMDRYAMLPRSAKGLSACRKNLAEARYRLRQLADQGRIGTLNYYRVRNILITADLVVKNALKRDQSLGAHCREDTIASMVPEDASGKDLGISMAYTHVD